MPRLHIYDRRERRLVLAADGMFAAAAALARPFRSRRPVASPRRILLLRLERIGDLVMVLPAIADVRRLAPDARIDLVVGSWNQSLASAVPEVSRVETLDAAWLARGGTGRGIVSLSRAARAWRTEDYDLAINFEPDLRSNVLLAASGAAWTAGYRSGGGGALVDVALDYDTRAHTTDNARRLVAAVFGEAQIPAESYRLAVPPSAAAAARQRIDGAARPLVGLHVSGGRAIKQWDLDRFAAAGRRLAAEGMTIILTGSAADRPLVDAVRTHLPSAQVVDAAGDLDLLELAALVRELDVLVTGDTGPMHVAAAVGTPIVAIFGPSDPARYAPRGPRDRVVRVELPCSPCNRIRLPPARCTGHTPDCLVLVSVEQVFEATLTVLDATRRAKAGSA
ncbi:MAG: hypothetical protein A3G21_02880 [Acidobacteria bacterium RIFCSPLOWO2_12_FULL_66_21]|nr:MAG: hypothetical protein A3G21_02880 [Acidobacteria bacterium RIFCSPLOWO2_12_FULL_66_21]